MQKRVYRPNSICQFHKNYYLEQEKAEDVPVLRHLFKTVRDTKNYINSLYSTPPMWRSIGPYVLEVLNRQGSKLAQIDVNDEVSLTYQELKEKSIRFAIGFGTLGLKPSDVVAIDGTNYNVTCALVLACLMAGYIVLFFDSYTNMEHFAKILSTERVKLIVASSTLMDLLKPELEQYKTYKPILMSNKNSKYYRCVEEIEKQFENENTSKFKPHTYKNLQQTVVLYLTNETGIFPKLAQFTQKTVMSLFHMGNLFAKNAYELDFGRYLQPGSFAIVTIFCVFICVLEMGGVRIMITHRQDNLLLGFKNLVKYEIDVMCSGVQTWRYIYNNKEIKNVLRESTIKTCIVTAESMPHFIKNDMKEHYPDKFLLEIYGLTEAAGILSVSSWAPGENIPEELNDAKGCLAQGWTLKVIDIQSRTVRGPFEPGELWIKSDFMISGYRNIKNDEDFDEEGFFRTGDFGYYDFDNVICVLDKVKELYHYKDREVSPNRLERKLLTHPKVRNACVVAVPHRECGQVAMAVCEAPDAIAEEIEDFIENSLPEHYHLKGGVKFMDKIPTTRTGKNFKKKVRQEFGLAAID